MGPKSIQDVVPPPQAISPTAEPPSGPEIVGDIPVRAPIQQATVTEESLESKNPDSSFIVPVAPPPTVANKNNEKPKSKDSNPKPTLAIMVAAAAIICLAAGAYLKFYSNR